MESLASPEHEWAVPAYRFSLNYAFIVSVLLHVVGFTLVALWWSEPAIHNIVPNDRRLSVSLVAAPVDTPEPKSPRQAQPAVTQTTPMPMEKAAVSDVKQAPAVARPVPPPVPESRQSARKPVSTMIEEAVRDTPFVEPEAAQRDGSIVFDPRLRAKLAAVRDSASRGESRGLTSYSKSNGAMHVDLGNGRCLEVRREVGMDNREVWWTASCPEGD